MSTFTFDTHQFISTLIEAGFETKQAEAVSAAFKAAQSDADLKIDLIKWMAEFLIERAAVTATLVKLL
jgi:hypothetical protein